jgi:hypothetical protein
MKNLIFLVFCLFLISGCVKRDRQSGEQSEPVKIEKNDSTTTPPANKIDGGAKDVSNTSEGIEMRKFNKNDLPSSIKYQGKIVEGAYWTDKNGDNILIITQTDRKNVNKDVREQYLFAHHYINYDDGYSHLWSITDYVKSYCDVDASYIPNSLEIVDIDGDDIAESLFLYKLDDRCDVSPIPIKLIMHKGDTKLVIRGTIGVNAGGGYKVKGKKIFDAAFNNVPANFKKYASDKWDKYVKDKEP